MAELCAGCFIDYLLPPLSDVAGIVLSDEYDLCEGCGEWKPFVLDTNRISTRTVMEVIAETKSEMRQFILDTYPDESVEFEHDFETGLVIGTENYIFGWTKPNEKFNGDFPSAKVLRFGKYENALYFEQNRGV